MKKKEKRKEKKGRQGGVGENASTGEAAYRNAWK